MKPALLIIDMQKGCLRTSPASEISMTKAIRYINAAIQLFRERDFPIFCVQHISKEHKMEPGSEDFDLPESLNVATSDIRIHKTYGNAFHRTSLAEQLRGLGVDTVLVTGYCAEYCVLSTYRAAEDHDFTPIILRGALASDDDANIEFVERISDLVTFDALRKLMGE